MRTGRKGTYKGETYLFTHRNPKTGEVWSDEIKNGFKDGEKIPDGRWVSGDDVKWQEEKQ